MKQPRTQLFSAVIALVFISLAVGSAPDPSRFRRKKKKPITEEAIMSNPNLTDKEKSDLVQKLNKTIEEERKTKTVSAIDLSEAYDANEVSADQQYKNEILYVEGYIEDIGKDFFDDIYVTLEGSEDVFRSVSCDINDAKVVSKLRKGQWLVVRGRCDGLMLDVNLKNCQVIEVRDVSPEDEEEMDEDEEEEVI